MKHTWGKIPVPADQDLLATLEAAEEQGWEVFQVLQDLCVENGEGVLKTFILVRQAEVVKRTIPA